MVIAYFAMKFTFFFSLVRSFVKYEPLQDHFVFLAMLYTAAVAFMSYVFLQSPRTDVIDWFAWKQWLAITFLISTVYFWLLSRYDEGLFFWILIVAGIGVWLF